MITVYIKMAAPSNIVRVLARAKRLNDSVPVQLDFTQSVIDYLSGDGKKDVIDAFFWTEHSPTHAVVSATPKAKEDKPLKLKRPSFCPIHQLPVSRYAELDSNVVSRGIDVGAAVLIESSDGKILLIRRAKHLRTFPNIWVPAGGHVEQGESVNEAGFRELREETGLKITQDMLETPPKTLCLWESAFPPKLTAGLPKRHHVVIYLHCKLRNIAQDIQPLLKPDTNEVGACAWFEPEVVAGVVSASEEDSTVADHADGSIQAYEVLEDGSLRAAEVALSSLYAKSDGSKEDIERVSTGTKWALENWLNLTKE